MDQKVTSVPLGQQALVGCMALEPEPELVGKALLLRRSSCLMACVDCTVLPRHTRLWCMLNNRKSWHLAATLLEFRTWAPPPCGLGAGTVPENHIWAAAQHYFYGERGRDHGLDVADSQPKPRPAIQTPRAPPQ